MSATEIVTQPSILLPVHTLNAACSSASSANLLKANIWDYSFDDICEIEKIAKQIKREQGKDSSRYQELKVTLTQLHAAHMPFRCYAFWKNTKRGSLPHRFFEGIQKTVKYKPPASKENRREMKQKLVELFSPPEIQEKLKLLSRLTFIHGSSTSALAMMLLSGNFQLKCTGALLADRIAPMCGELTVGISNIGVNNANVSVETVRDIERIKSYAGIAYFSPKHLAHLFDLKSYNLFMESQWNRRTIEILQLKQWDYHAFAHGIVPHRAAWLEGLDQEKQKQEKPLRQLLAWIEHDFTSEEKEFLDAYRSTGPTCSIPMPSSLLPIFPSVMDIPRTGEVSIGFSVNTVKNEVAYIRRGCSSWTELQIKTLDTKLEGGQQEHLDQLKTIFIKQLDLIQAGHQRIVSELMSDAPPAVQIPSDEKVRSLITDPAPIIFASTTVKPKPSHSDINPMEYLLDTPVSLCEKECGILFTDTEGSRDRIRSVLPEHLREEIEVRLFDELQVGELPLIHAPFQIRDA
ncbi:MAG: hypothetical protein JSR39_00035 [Verrucomicrobia bacterium]|nr:hypothetical protein [Verrucomicrobiota bacterium]